MKQPGIGLWRIKSLKDKYLSLLIAAVLLLSSFCANAQSYTIVNGRYIYTDSIKLSKLKNNLAKDSVLTTDSSGRIILKYISPVSSSNEITGEKADYSANTTITLAHSAIVNSLKLIKNGIRLPDFKYTISGGIITLMDARVSTDIFLSDYKF